MSLLLLWERDYYADRKGKREYFKALGTKTVA